MALIKFLLPVLSFLSLQCKPAHGSSLRRDTDAGAAPSTDVTASNPSFSTEELFNMTIRFADSFISPANKQQAAAINSTMFSEDVLGRVDATRNFAGRELNTEYIYGLFAGSPATSAPDYFTLLGEPQRYNLTHWTGAGNVAAYSTVVYLKEPLQEALVPFEIDVWLTFNKDREISQYDVTFRWLQWAFDNLAKAQMIAANMTDAAAFQGLVAQKLANSICGIAQGSCNGTNQQYGSKDECMDFLTKQTRFGQTYEMGMNTLLCRMVHQTMVPLRPDVHCSHIGKTGGEYCVDDRDYGKVVTEKYFSNSQFVAMGL